MFQNGSIVKTVAVIQVIIGMAASIAMGIYCMLNYIEWLGVGIIIAGCFGSLVDWLLLYGVGELLDRTAERGNDIKKPSVVYEGGRGTEQEAVEERESEQSNEPLPNECPNCFTKITEGDAECPYFGYQLKNKE